MIRNLRLAVRGSAEVVLKPECAKLLVAAPATPDKLAKPKPGHKPGDAWRCRTEQSGPKSLQNAHSLENELIL